MLHYSFSETPPVGAIRWKGLGGGFSSFLGTTCAESVSECARGRRSLEEEEV